MTWNPWRCYDQLQDFDLVVQVFDLAVQDFDLVVQDFDLVDGSHHHLAIPFCIGHRHVGLASAACQIF